MVAYFLRWTLLNFSSIPDEQSQQKVRQLGRITRAVINKSNEVKCQLLWKFWSYNFSRRILERVFVGIIVNIRNECLFRAQEPLGSSDLLWSRVVRRPSVVRRPLNYLHFRLLLQNRLMDFDETWYGWCTQGPLQVLLFFGQIRRGADSERGKNRSRGVPFFKKLLLQSGRLQQQTECIAVI